MKLVTQIDSAAVAGSNEFFINSCKNNLISAIAVHVQKDSENTLYLSFPDSSEENTAVTFEEFCLHLSRNENSILVHCLLVHSNLEMDIKDIAVRHGVYEQIIYSGKINPVYISKWDREKIYYEADNCLPGIYDTEGLKKAHFDVIHYFCRKYSMSTIQLRADFFTEEVQKWCSDNELSLVLRDPSSVEEIHELKKAGVKWILADSELVFKYQKQYSDGELVN